MVRVFGHDWTHRWGSEGETQTIKVYSNCPKVELLLDGQSLGIKKRNPENFPAAGLRWPFKLSEGTHTVVAIGFTSAGKKVSDTTSFTYTIGAWGPPHHIELTALKQGDGAYRIEAIAVDAQGNRCFDAKQPITFDLTGDGELIKNLGTRYGSKVIELQNGKAAIDVLTNQGSSVVSLSCKGLPTQFISIN